MPINESAAEQQRRALAPEATYDGLRERLDAHRQTTNPWAVIAELKLQLAARDRKIAELADFERRAVVAEMKLQEMEVKN